MIQGAQSEERGVGDYFTTFPGMPTPPLHPKIRAMLDAEGPLPPPDTLAVAEVRAVREAMMLRRPKLDESVARVEDRTIPCAGGKIPVRIYTPQASGPHPILAYFHGGGWVLGSLDTHDGVCRSLCHRAGCVVVSIDYRRAPEHKFPAALEDCSAAVKWCAERAAEITGDGARLAIAGDSAGGNLAAALALAFRDKGGPDLALQVLIYPVVNYEFNTASYHEYAAGYGLTRDSMWYFWRSYLPTPTDGESPYASPLLAKDLGGLPPALILTAQYDVLRDEGEAYAARLSQAGVPVRCTRYLELNHGFVQIAAVCDPANRGLQEIADALRAAWRL
jgi:acetyl esterase